MLRPESERDSLSYPIQFHGDKMIKLKIQVKNVATPSAFISWNQETFENKEKYMSTGYQSNEPFDMYCRPDTFFEQPVRYARKMERHEISLANGGTFDFKLFNSGKYHDATVDLTIPLISPGFHVGELTFNDVYVEHATNSYRVDSYIDDYVRVMNYCVTNHIPIVNNKIYVVLGSPEDIALDLMGVPRHAQWLIKPKEYLKSIIPKSIMAGILCGAINEITIISWAL